MKKTAIVTTAILMTTVSTSAFGMAKDGCGGECSTCHSLSVKDANTLLGGMGGKVTQVKPAPVRGLWEVTVTQPKGETAVAYVDYGKKHIIPGPVFSIATRKPVTSSGAPAPAKVQKVNFGAIPLKDSILVGNPQGKKKLVIFTDPDCPFCAKQHAELNKLVAKDKDVAVYIKLNPLKIHPKAYDRARVILESGSGKLLDDAFTGKPLPPTTSRTPTAAIDRTIKLAQTLGLKATPTVVLPDGRVLVGLQEVAELEKVLGEKK